MPVQPAGRLLELRLLGHSVLWLAVFDAGEDTVGFGAPVGTAGEALLALRTEQPIIGEVGNPGLAFGRALRRPRREADLAHGFRPLADFLGAAPATFDHPLEEVGALFLPVDAGKGFL